MSLRDPDIKIDSLSRAFEPKVLGKSSLSLPNCFIKAATYEGFYQNSLPTEALTNHHVELAKGGVGLTTVSYGAVSSDARTFEDQMFINSKSLPLLKELCDKVHEVDGKVSIQLTHCGFFSKNKECKSLLAPSKIFNAYGFLKGLIFSKPMSQSDMDQVKLEFSQAAKSVKNAGFDAIEIHMGHGYLLSQFLSPHTNKRKDQYGGSVENRSRYPMEVFRSIRQAVGSDFPVLVKLNLEDGFKNGFSIEDCIYVSSALVKEGCACVVLSGGFTSKTPFFMMRGDIPLQGMTKNATSLAEKITMKFFGPLIIKKYPYSSSFFYDKALQVRRAVSGELAYLGGVDSKQSIEKIAGAGFQWIALARPLIHDPEFLNKIKSGELEASSCNRCNECIVEMDRGGVKCVLNES